MKKETLKYILLVISLIFIDQLSKYLVLIYLKTDFIIIKNFLKLSFLYNDGVAFGLFSGNTLLLILINILLILYIIKEIKTSTNKLSIISLLLILSGAFGNLIDRIFRHSVVDFVSFTLFNKEMPIFNFADILITFGVIMLFITLVKGGKNDKNNK